jgi:hypothetical protein
MSDSIESDALIVLCRGAPKAFEALSAMMMMMHDLSIRITVLCMKMAETANDSLINQQSTNNNQRYFLESEHTATVTCDDSNLRSTLEYGLFDRRDEAFFRHTFPAAMFVIAAAVPPNIRIRLHYWKQKPMLIASRSSCGGLCPTAISTFVTVAKLVGRR